ncbi:hypothetical protein [Prolixibacter denitrificans]|uniref:Uncharacterized protein n=2 Tax=Prolixibacter denitrificans TaxID=1541063 RepID=A0ABQ0ZGF4_9BACT|nr:hypothetical protein [Prolixibacter denitrificans]GET20469.1 hypothetical protein JCM18694_07150 [Prolixibacter denitrificans]
MNDIMNYTGADIQAAEQAIVDAWNVYLQRKERYDGSVSKGHEGYAKRHFLKPMNQAYADWERAVQYRDSIVSGIDTVENLDYMNAQRDYQSAQLDGASSGTSQQDVSSYIYLGLAVLVIAYFWQS